MARARAPHWKRTGRRRPNEVVQHSRIQGIIDCLEIAKKTGIRLQMAHLFGGYNVTPAAPPALQEAIGRSTLDVINRYRDEGLEVCFEVIPYNAIGRAWPLYSRLTPWLRLLGTKEKLVEWLRVPDFRQEIKDALNAGKFYGFNPRTNPRWGELVKIRKHSKTTYMGKTITQIAADLEKDTIDALFDLIVEDPDSEGWTQDYRGTEEYLKVFFKHPLSMVGCDTRTYDDKRRQESPPWPIPGINDYAAYPSFLTRYVNEQKLFTIEEAAQKTSTLPARAYDLKDRGVLREGAYADIVLIDWPNLRVMGDLDEPRRYPKGIEYLFVNGTIVVDKGKHTGARPGKIILRE